MSARIRFGVRPCLALSTVDDHAGEYIATSFFHLAYLPIAPARSWWVTGGRAFPLELHARSVLAVYLRLWAPIAAIALIATAIPEAILIAIVLVAASAVSWSRRRLPAMQLRQRSFNRGAYGFGVDARHLPRPHRARLRVLLSARWDAASVGRSAEDIQTHGPRTLDEAVIAYGLLQFMAAEDGRAASGIGVGANHILATFVR